MIQDQPINKVEWVERGKLRANDYNPNHVAKPELKLLKLSILEDGWTQPIVIRDDNEIVDGFHRWTISADPEVHAMTNGHVPVVRLAKLGLEHQMMSTIRHNRARGQHKIRSMADIVKALRDYHKVGEDEIARRLGMDSEEVQRLGDSRGVAARQAKQGFNTAWGPDAGEVHD
jgi:ParB-like chromosome segregation protein Spo0J